MVEQLNLKWLPSKTFIIQMELISLMKNGRKCLKTRKYDVFAIILKTKGLDLYFLLS